MKRLWMAAGAALLTFSLLPGWAAKGTVAVLPANVFKGSQDNGPVITAAIRTSLERHGYTVITAARVENAIKAQGMDLTKPQNLQTLGGLRSAAGADFVVYPRVMSVGHGVNSQSYQANIMINVMGKSTQGFVWTTQKGPPFRTNAKDPDQAVIGKNDAEAAAEALLEGFYKKGR